MELARGGEGRGGETGFRQNTCLCKGPGAVVGRMGPVGPRGQSARREPGKRPRALCTAVRTLS